MTIGYESWTDVDLVEELADRESGLSAWEAGFSDKMCRWVLDDEMELTERQKTKIIEILRDNDG